METLFDIKTEITFGSNFGYISPRTIDAAVRAIQKKDSGAKETYQRGHHNNQWYVYLKSSLSATELRMILTNFIQKYDYLRFNLIVKS